MNEHEFKLATEPFETIVAGKKTIESRLYDDKRRTIQLNDIIVFTNRDNPAQTLRVKVIGLLRYASFVDMFRHNDFSKFGGKSIDWLLQQINEFYTAQEQEQYGVIGIEFKLI